MNYDLVMTSVLVENIALINIVYSARYQSGTVPPKMCTMKTARS